MSVPQMLLDGRDLHILILAEIILRGLKTYVPAPPWGGNPPRSNDQRKSDNYLITKEKDVNGLVNLRDAANLFASLQ